MAKGVTAKRTGLAWGRNKGHKVNVIAKKDRRKKPSNRKGRLGQRTAFVREVIREICGFSPYEKRMLELLRTNDPKHAKKAYRFAKVRLGTHTRALRKREELMGIVRVEAQRERAAQLIRDQEQAKKDKIKKAKEAAEARARAEAEKEAKEATKAE